MITNLTYVNGFEVRAQMTDETSETAQTIVVCDRGENERDRYVVWTVAATYLPRYGRKIEAWNGHYCAAYARALAVAAERASGQGVTAEPQTTDTPETIAQRAADVHWSNAFSQDDSVARYDSPVYQASQRMLLAAIRAAYNLSALKAQRVYDVWADCGESVAWCVEYVKTHRYSTAYSR
jgi:hypothetical protein